MRLFAVRCWRSRKSVCWHPHNIRGPRWRRGDPCRNHRSCAYFRSAPRNCRCWGHPDSKHLSASHCPDWSHCQNRKPPKRSVSFRAHTPEQSSAPVYPYRSQSSLHRYDRDSGKGLPTRSWKRCHSAADWHFHSPKDHDLWYRQWHIPKRHCFPRYKPPASS